MKRFLAVFMLISAFAGGILYLNCNYTIADKKDLIETREEVALLNLTNKNITSIFRDIAGDLKFLGRHHEMVLLVEYEGGAPSDLYQDFIEFLAHARRYASIRYTDNSGNEIFRFDYNDGKPEMASKNRLRNRADTPWFKQATTFKKGEIYISPFVLETENGAVKNLPKPIIRFATPLFTSHGEKQGVVALDYYGEIFLDNFRSAASSAAGEISLLNRSGYWLMGPKPEDLWGFMLEERKDRTFGNRYPTAWKIIRQKESGHFYTSRGLFTFATIYPFRAVNSAPEGTAAPSVHLSNGEKSESYHWKIVSRIPSATFGEIEKQSRTLFMRDYLILVAALGGFFFLYDRRRKAEQAKNEFEEHYRHLVDNMPDGVVVHRNGTIRFANLAAINMFGGKSAKDIVGKKAIELVHPTYRQKVLARIELAVKGEKADLTENRLVRLDGEPFEAEVVGIPVMFEGEKSVMVILQDVSARKKAEREVLEKAGFIDSILRSSLDVALIATDPEFHVTYFNPMAEKMFGYTADEVTGKTVKEMHLLEKVDHIRFEEAIKKVDEIGEYFFTTEWEKDGEPQYLDSRISQVCDHNGDLLGYLKLTRDVTKKKKAESALRKAKEEAGVARDFLQMLIDAIPSPVFYKNAEGCYTGCNRAFAEFLGKPREEIIGKTVYDMGPKELGDIYRRMDDELFERGGTQRYESSVLHADGTRHNVIFNKAVFNNPDGSIGGLIGVILDITDLKRAKEELRIARDKAEEANRIKDKFISLVSHDLKGPLGSLLGLLTVLKEDESEALSNIGKRIINSSLKSGEYMMALIQSLLNISRLRLGNVEPKREFIDLYPLVVQIIGNLAGMAEKKGIKLLNRIPGSTRIYADENLLAQVIQNMVSNSIKFSNEGGTITVYMPENEPSTIAVADTGIGIAPERLDTLFSYEVKTSTPGTAGEIGTGLGLPLTRDIMKAHNGDLVVESVPGNGTIFYAKLPYVKPLALIADGDDPDRAFFRECLEKMGADVLEADNDSAAVALLEKHRPHLIVADIGMEGVAGLSLLEQVKGNRKTKSIPVIVVAACGNSAMRTKALALGADDFICKPMEQRDFIKLAGNFIGNFLQNRG